MRNLFIAALLFCSTGVMAQKTFPKDDPKYNQPDIYALTNAHIHISSEQSIESGTLLVEKNKIIEVGKNVSIPKNAVVIDLKGKHVYPSFIDMYAAYGMPEVKRGAWSPYPQYETSKKGPSNWNEAIHPETNAVDLYKAEANSAKEWRNLGFGTVLTHYMDGIMRGTGAVVMLNEGKENLSVLKNQAAQFMSFNKGSSQQAYPSSLMGTIALIRQTLYDADWYKNGGHKKEFNPSLEALNKNQPLPMVFEASDKYNILRANKIAQEFKLKFIYKAGGNEYQRVKEIKNTGAALIVPVNYPSAFDVEDYYEAQYLSLGDLKHWELAPGNLYELYRNNITFAITTDGLKDKSTFMAQIKKAIQYGLPEKIAIKAITETPANLLGIQDQVGTLEKNKLANFIVTNHPLFNEKCIIHENWVNGFRYEIKPMDVVDLRGDYSVNINQIMYTLAVTGEPGALSAEIKSDTIKVKANLKKDVNTLALSFIAKDSKLNGPVRLSATINYDSGSWDGTGQLPNGEIVKWTAIRKEKFKEKENKKETKADSISVGKITFPLMAFGLDSIPAAETFFIKNATVWTNEQEGILKNTDVIIKDGKISAIGKNLSAPAGKYTTIDGTNKHITTGIIDEHSHIAISSGVNEGAQTISAEVSIGDVVNSDDINIYRQLAGGVTCSQLLHGSANPIGGQSAIIKLRWGAAPEEMKIKGADGFIKFALGENVKQSNWGDNFNVRYPQSRMGVEQVFYDAFYKALAYENEWKTYSENLIKSKIKIDPPRKDIENEVLLEIIKSKRFITCHSYVQSEINMLMHVADSFGFKINTFTHILEGYKVADKMAKHGASGSTFSDWWAYKFEVYDAIPYNAALLTKMKVNAGINSDDAEMARRLNQEAAKAIKYGNLSEEEAWKLVTLNPAKMLHIDNITGSLKKGKDADVVIWSDNPLSVYAKVEKTFVDGKLLFDRDIDAKKQKENTEEKLRIIKKMMEAKASGEKTIKPVRKKNRQYHCETLGEEAEEMN